MSENSNLINSLSKLPTMVQQGRETITPIAPNTPTSVSVVFSTPFPGVPIVIPIMRTGVPGTTVLGVGVTDESTTGFTLWGTRTNTTGIAVGWIAIY